MVVNLFDLKRVLLQVLEEFDHKHLNLDLPYFNHQIPAETWRVFSGISCKPSRTSVRFSGCLCMRDEDLCADPHGRGRPGCGLCDQTVFIYGRARGHRGHTWDLFVRCMGRFILRPGW